MQSNPCVLAAGGGIFDNRPDLNPWPSGSQCRLSKPWPRPLFATSLSLSFALPALPLQSGFTQFEISEEQNNWSSICTSSRFNKWDSCFTQLIWWLSGVFGVISYTEARELRNGCSWCCNSAATYSSPLCVRQKKEKKEMKKGKKEVWHRQSFRSRIWRKQRVDRNDWWGLCVKPCSLLHNILL